MYVHFTDEQKLRANSVDLEEFLRRQGEKLLPSGREKRLESDHSVTVRGNQWFDHASEEGGHAISFLQKFYGLSYPEAVTHLLNGEKGVAYRPADQRREEVRKPFALPAVNKEMRRVYAYLLKQRHISRQVLDSFVRAKLIYESRERSKDGSKEYHNAVFVGMDEDGTPRHAHKHGLYTQGKCYKGNVEGCDPRHSFHHLGDSDRLYVFEGPIDLMAFLTLYPVDWQRHSYVALCGTAEHAMLWMLERDPRLQNIILCLDHDAAGVEAAGRLADILAEKGYRQVGICRSQYKDWDEDLKAIHGIPAIPGEEHPQLAVCGAVCGRLAELCGTLGDVDPAQAVPPLLRQFREDTREDRMEHAAVCMEQMAALALWAVKEALRKLGKEVTDRQLGKYLAEQIRPHQNRGGLKGRCDELNEQLGHVLRLRSTAAKCGEEDQKQLGRAWIDLSLSCVKFLVKYEADQLRQRRKEELAQREAGPVMH